MSKSNGIIEDGDIIEVVDFQDGQLNLRRVKAGEIRYHGSQVSFVGKNLKGKHAKNYTLPKTPIKAVTNVAGWYHFGAL